jgi:hypothetical protein
MALLQCSFHSKAIFGVRAFRIKSVRQSRRRFPPRRGPTRRRAPNSPVPHYPHGSNWRPYCLAEGDLEAGLTFVPSMGGRRRVTFENAARRRARVNKDTGQIRRAFLTPWIRACAGMTRGEARAVLFPRASASKQKVPLRHRQLRRPEMRADFERPLGSKLDI